MAGDEEQDMCGRCGLEFNRDERCPRSLICGHVSCSSCLQVLIQEDKRRCPICSRSFFSLSVVLIPKDFKVLRRLGDSSSSSSKSYVTSSSKSYVSSSFGSSRAKDTFDIGSSLRPRSEGGGVGLPVASTRIYSPPTVLDNGGSLRPKSEGGGVGLPVVSHRMSAPPPVPSSAPPKDTFDIGGSRPRSEGGDVGLPVVSHRISAPPPVPSSVPPSLDETSEGLTTVVNEGEGGGGGSSGGDGGGSGISLPVSSSSDQTSERINTPYVFPAITTRLSRTDDASSNRINNDASRTDIDAFPSRTSGNKKELRPVKSLPPITSSSSAFRSLPPLQSPLSARTEGPAKYTSPFLTPTSSSTSSFSTNTFRSLQSASRKLSTHTTSSNLHLGDKGITQSSFNDSMDSSGLSRSISMDSSGLSRSMSGLHKLESKLSVPPAGKQDEVDLGVSKWKLESPLSLSRKRYSDYSATPSKGYQNKTNTHDVSSNTEGQSDRQTDRHNASPLSTTRLSGTPTHVLRMCRSITSKTRPATADDDPSTTHQTEPYDTSTSSYQKTTSFPSSSSSSSTSFSSSSSAGASKDTHPPQRISQEAQEDTQALKDTPLIGMREAAPQTPPPDIPASGATSEGNSHSITLLSSLGSRRDASEASEALAARASVRKEMKGQRGEAGDADPHSPPAASPLEREKSKETRKLAFSVSLSARLGARTRFLAAAIDEETEEVDPSDASVKGGMREGRDGEAYEPDRRGVQAAQRPHASLGARISARASYLLGGQGGGRGEAERVTVQAEDWTKIAPRRREEEEGRAGTKREPAAGEHEGEDADDGTPPLYTPEGGDAGDAETPRRFPRETGGLGITETVRNPSRYPGVKGGETGDKAGTRVRSSDAPILTPRSLGVEGASHEAYSVSRMPRDVMGVAAAPLHEASPHSRWGRHLIDSRPKEELSDPGCEVLAAPGLEASHTLTGGTSGHHTRPDKGFASHRPALNGLDIEPREDDYQRTKRDEKQPGMISGFRSGPRNAIAFSDTADGSSAVSGDILDGDTNMTAAQQPAADLFPWRKKWRSLNDTASLTRHTPFSGAERQTEQQTAPRGLEQQITAPQGLEQQITTHRGLEQQITAHRGLEQQTAAPRGFEQQITAHRGLEQQITAPRGLEQQITTSRGLEQQITAPRGLEQQITAHRGLEQQTAAPRGLEQQITASRGLEQQITAPRGLEQQTAHKGLEQQTAHRGLEQQITAPRGLEQQTTALLSLAQQQEGFKTAGNRQEISLTSQRDGRSTGGDANEPHSSRGSLGVLSIGRVSSIQDTDDAQTQIARHDAAQTTDETSSQQPSNTYRRERREGQLEGDARGTVVSTDVRLTIDQGSERSAMLGTSLNSHEGRNSRTHDDARHTQTVPRGATTDTTAEGTQSTDRRLGMARDRLQGTTTTPTKEEAPTATSRTNLTYLLARLQTTEAKRTIPTDEEDDDVFYETSEDEDNTPQQRPKPGSSVMLMGGIRTGDSTDEDVEASIDEPDSVTRRLSLGRRYPDEGTAGTNQLNHGDNIQGTDYTDGPYEDSDDAGLLEYEPGVGLCASHDLMLHLYCEDCEEWVCDECLKVLHRPRPHGSCRVISAAEGVTQMKVNHASFLTSRTNTLEYFREELERIAAECENSISIHGDNVHRLEEEIDQEERLIRGIESMRNLTKEKLRQVDYWEDVLKKNLSRIDESSTSDDVLEAVRETTEDIMQKAMKAVSQEAGAGLLLSPPNY